MVKSNNCMVTENIVVYALRYSLGRSSYSPMEVIESVVENLDNFNLYILKIIRNEIQEFLNRYKSSNIRLENIYHWESLLKKIDDKIVLKENEK